MDEQMVKQFPFLFFKLNHHNFNKTFITFSLPTNANAWVTERVDLFNELVNQKKVQKRLVHFVNYYLELDGNFERLILLQVYPI